MNTICTTCTMSHRSGQMLIRQGAIGAVLLAALVGCERNPEDAAEGTVASGQAAASADMPVLFSVPEFALTDQRGERFGSAQLAGKVWFANFIFTRCRATCPMQTGKLAQLQGQLATHPRWNDMQLVSFSVDPEFDTPEVLRAYAEQANADGDRWRFLTGSRAAIWDLSAKGFKLAVGENAPDRGAALFHSSNLMLVDHEGQVRGVYDGMTDQGIRQAKRGLLTVLEEAPVGAAGPSADKIAVPEEILDPPWLEGRRQAQLAMRTDLGVFHDFAYRDEWERSGIRFRHRIVDDAGRTYKAAHYDHGNGIAVADVDGDGRHDVYFVNQVGANALWHNNGDGTFQDVTARAGVAMTDPIGVTASFADVDNDGDPDLFVTTVRGGNVLFENDGTGRFRDVTTTAGLRYTGHSSAATFFDYDRDGDLDLFLSNVGRYTSDVERTVTPDGIDAEAADAEFKFFDAHKDAFAGHLKAERDETSILYGNNGDGTFTDVTERVGLTDVSYTGDATPIDANDDGWPDLYVLNMQGDDEYFENQAGEGFVRKSREVFPRTPWGSMGAKVFDFENDGRLDLYVTDMHSDMSQEVGPDEEKDKSVIQWPESFLRTGERSIFGNAFFRKITEDWYEEISDEIGAENYWPWGLSVGDLNADGYEDVFIASSMNYPFRYGVNSLLLNDRGRRLVDSEFILGVEPRRDGRTAFPYFKLDCSGADRNHRECRGRGGEITVWGALGSRSSVIFDFDGDGDLDIITNDFNSEPMVLVSDLTTQATVNYLGVELIGTTSNRDGLGARVTVRAGDRSYTRANDGKSGYLSQSLIPLYFGLGEATTVDAIEVLWPSGGRQTVAGPIEANQRLRIEEQ